MKCLLLCIHFSFQLTFPLMEIIFKNKHQTTFPLNLFLWESSLLFKRYQMKILHCWKYFINQVSATSQKDTTLWSSVDGVGGGRMGLSSWQVPPSPHGPFLNARSAPRGVGVREMTGWSLRWPGLLCHTVTHFLVWSQLEVVYTPDWQRAAILMTTAPKTSFLLSLPDRLRPTYPWCHLFPSLPFPSVWDCGGPLRTGKGWGLWMLEGGYKTLMGFSLIWLIYFDL